MRSVLLACVVAMALVGMAQPSQAVALNGRITSPIGAVNFEQPLDYNDTFFVVSSFTLEERKPTLLDHTIDFVLAKESILNITVDNVSTRGMASLDGFFSVFVDDVLVGQHVNTNKPGFELFLYATIKDLTPGVHSIKMSGLISPIEGQMFSPFYITSVGVTPLPASGALLGLALAGGAFRLWRRQHGPRLKQLEER